MKLPRDLSGDEVCRALKRLGFEFVRQTGSHRHYVKDSLHPCVPMHREIKPKTLQSILKQAEITVEALLDNLSNSDGVAIAPDFIRPPLTQRDAQYAQLRRRLAGLGWISQGYVQDRGPGAGGPCY